MTLRSGLYDQLVTDALNAEIENEALVVKCQSLSPDAAAEVLAKHIYTAAKRALSGVKGEAKLQDQIAMANTIIDGLAGAVKQVDIGDRATTQMLRSVREKAETGLGDGTVIRPKIPLRHSDLIVNGPRDLRVGAEISREIASSDSIDLIMSFVKFSGYVELRDALQPFCAQKRIRLLTTTYMGATDVEALDALEELGAEIRVSYDERRTRLHAKAWLFHRQTGFSTGIIGSSNLSSAALRDGCEWNVRLSTQDNPGLLSKFGTTFNQYWNDEVFEPYDRSRFLEATRSSVGRDGQKDALANVLELRPWPHQMEVLNALTTEREMGHYANLIVAATGTGKTVMAALDYARQPGRPSMLFVAHRDRILEQSRATFRIALKDGNFGEKLSAGARPVEGAHVFASIQSLHEKRLNSLDPHAYDVVIVDEFHHAAAASYARLLAHIKPRILLGLTATPERMDGKSILPYFGGRIAAESRLWDALDMNLLVPFQYFVLDDETDLSQVDFARGKYDIRALETLYTADEVRARQIVRALAERVRSPKDMRALGFCVSVKHAEFMAAYFNKIGLPASFVHGGVSHEERSVRVQQLKRGEVCCLFSVDVFNEGVDLPTVDTVLFLRPTESATIFVQQLGRGLRLHESKSCLTVLDFVGNANQEYRFDQRFRALLGGGTRAEIKTAVEEGFPSLPAGCAVILQARAKQIILNNLKRSVGQWRRLAADLQSEMGLAEYLDRTQIAVEDLYKARKSFQQLRAIAGFVESPPSGTMVNALARMLHVDDLKRLQNWSDWLSQDQPPAPDDGSVDQRVLFATLGQQKAPISTLGTFLKKIWNEPLLRDELRQLVDVLIDRMRHQTIPLENSELRVHGTYTRAEISAVLNIRNLAGDHLHVPREGAVRCNKHNCDLLFVTLEKDEKDFTPTTLYEDKIISPTLFSWETQFDVRRVSPTMQRYVDPPEGWRILLFVRESKRDARKMTRPFLFLGPVKHISNRSERPVKIEWELKHAVPGGWYNRVKVAAG